MFYLRRRINVASGTGTVWLPTLKQNLQGTYPRINQHVIFQPRRNVNKTHPGKGGHIFNLHLYKTECHRRLATRYWLNYSTIDTTCMFNHRSCLMKCFIVKDVEGLEVNPTGRLHENPARALTRAGLSPDLECPLLLYRDSHAQYIFVIGRPQIIFRGPHEPGSSNKKYVGPTYHIGDPT